LVTRLGFGGAALASPFASVDAADALAAFGKVCNHRERSREIVEGCR